LKRKTIIFLIIETSVVNLICIKKGITVELNIGCSDICIKKGITNSSRAHYVSCTSRKLFL